MEQERLKRQLKGILPFTCTDLDCPKRKSCRIKNDEIVTTPELNVRLKATTLDERVEFFPIKDCDSIDEAIINARLVTNAHNWLHAELYIDDKKIATIYG